MKKLFKKVFQSFGSDCQHRSWGRFVSSGSAFVAKPDNGVGQLQPLKIETAEMSERFIKQEWDHQTAYFFEFVQSGEICMTVW